MEIWKPISGYDDYEISNLGRVKSIKYNQEKFINGWNDKDGYKIISLSSNNIKKEYKLHRLIALAFIPNPDNKPCIDHIDRDKTNNSINNLRWATYSENNINMPLCRNNKLRQQYIIPVKQGIYNYYRIQITRNNKIVFRKHCKTLEDAIQLRDNFLINYKDETM